MYTPLFAKLMNIFSRFWNWLLSIFWKKQMSVTIIGLSNAGKTTLVKALMGQRDEDSIPTIGVEEKKFSKGGIEIKAWDIGGHKQFQFLWGSYCQNANAILFVLDAADEAAVEESAGKVRELLASEAIDRIPLLICGNKCDLPGALSEEQLISRFADIEGRDVALFSISAREAVNAQSYINTYVVVLHFVMLTAHL